MKVNVGGTLIDTTNGFPYYGWMDAAENVTIATADGSNPRIDAIVAYVDLTVVSSSNSNNPNALKLKAVSGTPAGSPTAPNDATIQTSVGGTNPFIRLAHVTVNAAATTITNANISDQRVFATVGSGNIGDSSVTPAKLQSGTGSSWAEQSWTPTFTNFTIGNGTRTSTYTQIGKQVFFRIEVTLGSTSSVSGTITFSLPVTAASTYTTSSPLARATIVDSGSARIYGTLLWATTTTVILDSEKADGVYLFGNGTSSSIPMNWTTNDGFYAQGFYWAP